jgi:hypothetical protein
MPFNSLHKQAPESTLVQGGAPTRGGFQPGKLGQLKTAVSGAAESITSPWNNLSISNKIFAQAKKEKRPLTPEENQFIADSVVELSLGMGTFIGAKGIAKLGKSDVLKAAEKMKLEGVPDKTIWNKLGTTFGFADKKPRMEISDAGMRLSPEGTGTISHPALFEAYPELLKVKTNIDIGSQNPKLSGFFDHGKNALVVKSPTISGAKTVASHELQHGVQTQEGLPRGGNLKEFKRKGFSDADALAMYKRLSGEAEARLTHSRRTLTDAERRLRYPISEFDIPPAQQIIRQR